MKVTRVALFAISTWMWLVLVVASPCRSQSNGSIYIHPSVTGEDHRLLLNMMTQLPENERGNCTLIKIDGTVIANRPELLDEVGFQAGGETVPPPDIPCPTEDLPAEEPEEPFGPVPHVTVLLPKLVPFLKGCFIIDGLIGHFPPTHRGTGPYYRVYSRVPPTPNHAGYNCESAFVQLRGSWPATSPPPRAIVGDIYMAGSSGETPYVYVGGWTLSGGSVDAGFQYNTTLVPRIGLHLYAAAERNSPVQSVTGRHRLFR